jgi:hypothetical protein
VVSPRRAGLMHPPGTATASVTEHIVGPKHCLRAGWCFFEAKDQSTTEATWCLLRLRVQTLSKRSPTDAVYRRERSRWLRANASLVLSPISIRQLRPVVITESNANPGASTDEQPHARFVAARRSLRSEHRTSETNGKRERGGSAQGGSFRAVALLDAGDRRKIAIPKCDRALRRVGRDRNGDNWLARVGPNRRGG